MQIGGFRFWEVIAVLCSVLYTWLIADGNMWCWWFAIGASVIYMSLTFRVGLYAEAFLHFIYLIMAVYGLSRSNIWKVSGTSEILQWYLHFIIIFLAGILTYMTGWLLSKIRGARATYLDAFTTVYSLWATWLMVNFYPENWLYWIVIDAASAVLYFRRRLFISSVLYVAYTVMAVRGWILWTSA